MDVNTTLLAFDDRVRRYLWIAVFPNVTNGSIEKCSQRKSSKKGQTVVSGKTELEILDVEVHKKCKWKY